MPPDPSETSDPRETSARAGGDSPDAGAEVTPGRLRRRLPELRRFAELLGLTGLVVTQPILDSFASSPETFVFRRATTADIVWFALIVTFALPVALFVLEQATGLISRQARHVTHRAVLAVLLAVAGWQLVERHTGAGPGGHLLAALALAAAGSAAHHFLQPARAVLLALAPITVVVAGAWLFASPVSEVAFASGPGTAAGVPVEDPAPILFVVFDELPTASILDDAGGVDAELFPNLAALADDATWYRNTTAVSPTTPEAVPAILTGRYPASLDLVPTSAAHPDNVFRALESTYDFNVWELITQLCPPEQCPELGGARHRGLWPLLGDAVDLWSTYMNTPPPSEQEAFAIRQSDPEAPANVERFIDSLESGTRPRLDFLHVALPHQPWRHLPGGTRHDAPFLAKGLVGHEYAWADPYFAQAGRQRHLLQVQRTDELLGAMLDRLRALDRYDETLVVVTADHGVAFSEGEPIRGLSPGNAPEILWVPLFVKAPGQTSPVVDDRPLETVDVLPTLADMIGMELPWEIEGHSALLDRTDDDHDRRFYPWGRNVVQPDPETGYATVDGRAGFRALFDRPVAGSPPRDDLQLHRFGRWGSLVGREVADLDVADALAGPGATTSVQLLDADGRPVARHHFDMLSDSVVVPTYVRGRLTDTDTDTDTGVGGPAGDPDDILVAVNGVVAGWGQVHHAEGARRFFVLAPQTLFAPRDNSVEVFRIDGDPDGPAGPRLHPLALDRGP
jgi:hypothetical protein